MDRRITRRDFVQGAALAVGAAAGLGAPARRARAEGPVGAPAPGPLDPATFPPARHGLRGSHEGSFEVAHELSWQGRTDWAPVHDVDDVYDLVVVGSGVSGLAAAFFYRKDHPGARVLIVENHDDFGGHAKRNEFEIDGRRVLGYGGSQSLENPSEYSSAAQGLLRELGVETRRLEDAYDQDFFRRHGLGPGIYFDSAHYGVDRVVRTDIVDPSLFLPVAKARLGDEAAVARMPISDAARQELLGLLRMDEDRLPDHSILSEPDFLDSLSYRDFLTKHLGVREPEVLRLLQDMPSGYFGHGIDVVPASEALLFGLPGLGGTSLRHLRGLIRRVIEWAVEPYVYHFPDGNASVARLLVRRLVPDVAPGETMYDVATAAFDYAKLDRQDSPVRLRLSSTAVRVAHEGGVGSAKTVAVTYVRAGRSERVRARHAILACYNRVIPWLCPELPAPQREALGELVKSPLVYTNVLLRRWHAFVDAGLALALCPGSWHQLAMLDFPVSFPGYSFASDPDQPIVLHMSRVPTSPGLPPREQSRAGRRELLATPFESIEREIRTHLGGMLTEGGFDPAAEIAGIVVNRWPHGYAWRPNPLFDPDFAPGEAPYELGRARFGRIAIANSDAGGRAYLDCAIDQAWRAVDELSA